MAKIIRLTESDLARIIKRVIKEQNKTTPVPIIINNRNKKNTNTAPTDDDGRKYFQACRSVTESPKIDSGRIRQAANKIVTAMEGVGTNEQPIYDVFNELEINGTFADFCNLKKEFDKVGEYTLEHYLTEDAYTSEWVGELTGDDRKYILTIVKTLYDKWMSTRR